MYGWQLTYRWLRVADVATVRLPRTDHPVEIKSGANTRLFAPFGKRVICGDDAAIERGKPFPDIFLTAARHGLGLQHTDEGRAWLEGVREPGAKADHELKGAEGEILVFEDALVRIYTSRPTRQPGVQAGLAAGIKGTQHRLTGSGMGA